MKGFFKYDFPIIELFVEGKKIEILLDTGFNGHLMLSSKLIKELNLEQIGFSDFTTASGDGKETMVYKTKIDFLNEEIEVPVLSTEGDFSLAGMELFYDCRIVIEKHLNLVEVIRISVSVND